MFTERQRMAIKESITYGPVIPGLRDRVVDLMRKRNLTEVSLSEKSGLSRSLVNTFLGGKNENLQLETLRKMACGLDCELAVTLTPKWNGEN